MPSRYEKYATHHTSRRTDGWDYTRPAAYFVTICTQDRACLFGTVERGRMWLNALGKIVAEEWQRSESIRDRVHLDAFVVMPNHLHGIVVFADPDVEAPTCPRGYRGFGAGDSGLDAGDDGPGMPGGTTDSPDPPNEENASTGGSADGSNPPDSQPASTGGSTDKSNSPNSRTASTGGSTLGGDDDVRPTGPAPRSLGSFIAGFKSAATMRINNHRDMPGAPVWQRNYHDVIIQNERHWRAAREYLRRNPAEWGGDRHYRDRESDA